VGSFAFKSSFLNRIFQFSCLGVVSPGRKMAAKFVKYGAHTQDFFLFFMLIVTNNPVKKHVKRAADSSKEPRTGSVTSFNVIPPKQDLHGHCLGLPVRGYDSSCGNSDSPAPLTE
jgi:hypothetical protein